MDSIVSISIEEGIVRGVGGEGLTGVAEQVCYVRKEM